MRGPVVPYLEPIAGGVWWTVGASALDTGAGTVILAAGLGVTAGLVVALRRRYGTGAPLPPGGRGRFLRLLGITLALVAVAGTVLGSFGLGELAVPLACAMIGVALIPLSTQLDDRSLLATGGALMVLGAVGALLALDSVGSLYPQGVVGLVAGALFWAAAAYRTGLLAEARGRVRR
ncbi:MAG: hypothetical protein JWR58_1971 [Pseudonocardia sp.]|jgi:hypothetical protein|nr:hypothetical protein [Pseudonocardia sp.]